MVLLTATALTYRAFTRSDQAMTQREQQVIVNAATPAIDRAKAKIEFIFQNDPRFPSGIPASDRLSDLMANERQVSLDEHNANPDENPRYAGYTKTIPLLIDGPPNDLAPDPYTLPDEERVNINSESEDSTALDNAWMFRTDIDGDGTISDDEIIVYSIIVDDIGPEEEETVALTEPNAQDKADAIVTRTGPLATTQPTDNCGGSLAEGGWQVVQPGNVSTLQKNFQVNVFVANTKDSNRTFEAMEFQQSRIAARASKWGAWFRYDLEIHPGSEFTFNGAMHTDGNLVLWGSDWEPYMVSSQNSCVYSQESSEITLGEFDNVEYDDETGPVDITQAAAGVLGDFQGQVYTAKTDGNSYQDDSFNVHVFDTRGTEPNEFALTRDNDSLDEGNSVPSDVAMNPLILFTQDKESHIDPTTGWGRNEDWDGPDNNFTQPDKERIYNQTIDRPFVDDFFRADNRWGPKPRYTASDDYDVTLNDAVTTGDEITGEIALTSDTEGYDGYWERQAIAKGLRLIVGERLELGNPNGWGYDPTTETIDPSREALYPHTSDGAHMDDINLPTGLDVAIHGGAHERLHRKSLQDNLAAVQSMAVYHYQGGGTNGMAANGEFPLACYALTAHPGTTQSIINSRTFGTWDLDGTGPKTDFFNGIGTNGWEFSFPAAFDEPGDSTAGFAAEVEDADSPLGTALRNLAYFAGDPAGGAPSFKVNQGVAGEDDGVIHPYPYLSMWGDYSMLRRVLAKVDNGTSYANLSFADQATLHSAACTLSMLAYNIEKETPDIDAALNAFSAEVQGNNEATQLRTEFGDLMASIRPDIVQGNPPTYEAGWPASKDPSTATDIPGCIQIGDAPANIQNDNDFDGFNLYCEDLDAYFQSFTLDEMIQVFEASRPPGETEEKTQEIVGLLRDLANSIVKVSALTRDRELGFKEGYPSLEFVDGFVSTVDWDPETGLNSPITIPGLANNADEISFTTGCDPNIFQNTASGDSPSAEGFRVSLAMVMCADIEKADVKYPSLFYLFPLENHTHFGDANDGNLQPGTEEYIADDYIGDATNGVNRSGVVTYSIVGTDALTGISEIAAVPKNTDGETGWVIPTTTGLGALSDPDTESFRITLPAGGGANVAFLDKGIFDGRQMLNSRVLDIDLDALTTEAVYTDSDYWLSADLDADAKGVVYAFREDAVREDEIVRPKGSDTITVADCMALDKQTGNDTRVFALEVNGTCFMNADPASAQDPPLTDEFISLKPVDFIPDPLRRDHGFRLRTASGEPADFSGGNPSEGRQVGMTFVSDNSVYIMGNFNPHSSDGSVDAANLLEEFDDRVFTAALDFDDFYDGRTAAELNTTDFANLEVDHWRPVEVLADSLTILSNNFDDGSVADTYTGSQSSYTNQTRNQDGSAIANWIKSDYPTSDAGAPVWVDRDGVYYFEQANGDIVPYYEEFDADGEWRSINENKNVQGATSTYVNAVFVSGVNPKRGNQGYGGLHNYPRMIENWGNDTMFIQGAFIQLNFSTYGTGPYEQEAFEPGDIPDGAEFIRYYTQPTRRWGYDVGLLYVPPAPAAERFVSIQSPRSEYYREVPADDPYIVNLRCAVDVNGDQVMPDFCPS